MGKIFKRIAAVAISAAMVVSGGFFSGCEGILGEAFSALSATVYAAPANWYEDYTYELSGTDIRLKRYNGSATEVTVPATAVIDGVTYQTVVCGNSSINSDDSLFENKYEITSIIFENGVKGDADMSYMFSYCHGLKSLDLSGLDTSNAENMKRMFNCCRGLTSLDVSEFDTSNVTDMADMFNRCSGLTSLDVSEFDTSNVTAMSGVFLGCSGLASLDVRDFDTSNVIYMGNMFDGCSGLMSLDVSGFETLNVQYMGYMFNGCSGLTSLDVSGFDTSNVERMDSMFEGCSGLTSLDVSGFDTSNVERMDSMFEGCSGLMSLDVSGFDTSNVERMYYMFSGCSGLTSLDVSGFDTPSLRWMYGMFSGCSSLTSLDVSGFDTSNVNDMYGMFSGCSGLTSLDLSGFDVSKVRNDPDTFQGLGEMFSNCDSLKMIKTPKVLNDTCEAILPVTMYLMNPDGSLDMSVAYTDMMKAPANSILVVSNDICPYDSVNGSSYEKIQAFIWRMYKLALGRDEVRGDEINYWSRMLYNHERTGADMAFQFCCGEEFKNRNLSDDEFSKIMYRVYMNRERGAGDLDGWTIPLANGANRKWIMAKFVNSPEYTMICWDYGIDRGTLDVPDSEEFAPN